MKIIRKTDELQQILVLIKNKGQSIGSVLTMGNLHDGHLSLIKEAQLNNDFVVTSIFINPTQFNNETDFSSYPKTIDDDIAKLEKIGCDLLFLPEIQEIYPGDVLKQNIVNNFRGILCDKYRPGHFDGVTTVVDIFFSIIKPNTSYFGEKDFQQIKIIQELVKIKNHNIKIVSCPSIRDDRGMSLSSRNSKFTNDQLKIFNQLGSKIYEFINLYKKKSSSINFDDFKKQILENSINKIDYIEIRNENNLEITDVSSKARLFIALYIGEIRIIDNFKLY